MHSLYEYFTVNATGTIAKGVKKLNWFQNLIVNKVVKTESGGDTLTLSHDCYSCEVTAEAILRQARGSGCEVDSRPQRQEGKASDLQNTLSDSRNQVASDTAALTKSVVQVEKKQSDQLREENSSLNKDPQESKAKPRKVLADRSFSNNEVNEADEIEELQKERVGIEDVRDAKEVAFNNLKNADIRILELWHQLTRGS
ncbi:hypothetical protein QQZ08_003686 [Neonectria magnoliae]|uniref:Uncharacterized protein n=1 Tax=Neonectria magnoliae TaxID=2732573 RepID=A0ABR1IAG3_9HYPO